MRNLDLAPTIAADVAQQPAAAWLAAWRSPEHTGSAWPEARKASTDRCMQLLNPAGSVQWAEHNRCCVVFDGVLYNHAELRRELGRTTEQPESAAAVLARAYEHWGSDVLAKIKGIFSLIIWDGRTNTLLGARDPLGIYPLFYAHVGHTVVFAPSLDTLVEHPLVPSTVNRAALADHLSHRWPFRDETFWQHIKRVPLGHALQIGNGEQRTYRYWDPTPPGTAVNWVREDELERFAHLLEQVIRRYLQLGPAAVLLSGGLDSVAVAAVATGTSAHAHMPPPLALSLAFPDPDCNEEDRQRQVAAQLGLSQIMVPFNQAAGDQGIFAAALELSATWPVPLTNFWLPAYQHLISQGTQRGCRVVLTGSGGDEWLGVTPLLAADLLRTGDVAGLYHLWNIYRRSFALPPSLLLRNMLWLFGARPLLGDAVHHGLRHVAPWALHLRRQRLLSQLTPAWVAPHAGLRGELHDRIAYSALQAAGEQRSGGVYQREMRTALDHPLIAWEMEESFEHSRRMGVLQLSPFWDAELVDLLYRTPPDLLNKGGRSKGLVRQSLAQQFPALDFERQKKVVALNFFQSVCVNQGQRAWKQLGGAPALTELGIVDPHRLNTMIEHLFAGNQRNVYRIWEVLNLEMWLRSRI